MKDNELKEDDFAQLEEIKEEIPVATSTKVLKVKDVRTGRSRTFKGKDEFEAKYGIEF